LIFKDGAAHRRERGRQRLTLSMVPKGLPISMESPAFTPKIHQSDVAELLDRVTR